jgi:hypothetical protein
LFYPNYDTGNVGDLLEFITLGKVNVPYNNYWGLTGETIGWWYKTVNLWINNFFGKNMIILSMLGNTLRYEDNTNISSSDTSYKIIKTYTTKIKGKMYVSYNVNNSIYYSYAQLLKNWTFIPWSEIRENNPANDFEIEVNFGDIIELQIRTANSNVAASSNIFKFNFDLYYYETLQEFFVY